MSNGKALLAGVLGLVALLAIVVGTFTVTSNAEPAEADCFEISCFIEFLTMDPCESEIVGNPGAAQFDLCQLCPESSCITDVLGLLENCDLSGETPLQSLCCEPLEEETNAALIDLCCEPVEFDGVNAAFIDPCQLCLDPSCLIDYLTTDPCQPEVTGALFFGNQCCEVDDFESEAALFNPCCESESLPITGAAFIDLCCESEPTEGFSAVLFNPCCEQLPEENPTATFFNLGCDCDPPVPSDPNAAFIGSGDMLSQLFAEGLLTLLGLGEPCNPEEELP